MTEINKPSYSKEQLEQQKMNRQKGLANDNVNSPDRKLDGPNRPAE